MVQKEKIICIVLEGMGTKLLNQYMNQGYLKNIHSLMREQGGLLLSSKVPYEGSALQTAFTGYQPEETGVYSYWHIHNYHYIPQIITSDQLEKKSIWQREEMNDRRFAVINIFGTHKPYPINGYMLTYLFQQSLRACYPENLIRELSKAGFPYGNDVSALYTGTEREKFLNMIFQLEKKRINVAFELLKKVDVLIANFTIVDRLSHFYMQELDSEVFQEKTESAIFKAYELMDETVGRFLDEMDKDTQLFVFSDLGFGSLREFFSLNSYLEKENFLRREKNGQFDWKRTIAFESIQGSHGVNINLKGLYRDGIVGMEQFESVRNEVMEYLNKLINPKTGLPYFKAVIKGEEFYSGTYSNKAPHIMLEAFDERYLPLGDNYWAEHVHRHYQSGWHRREGFWTGKGNKIDGVKKDGSVLDISPTLFGLMNKSVPIEFKGKSLIS